MITLLASFFFLVEFLDGALRRAVGAVPRLLLLLVDWWWWGWVALQRVASHCLNHAANYSCELRPYEYERRRWIMGLGSCFGHHNIRASKDGHIEAQSSCQGVIRKPTAAMLGIHDRKRTESFPQLSFDRQIPVPASSIYNQFLLF